MPPLPRPWTYRARALRRAETPAEQVLWRWLRGRKLEGAKFRRQHPLGPFVVDFFSEEARLVIEPMEPSTFRAHCVIKSATVG
jgi:very-short-patch-repair endonuclease